MKDWWNINWPALLLVGLMAAGMFLIGVKNGWT